MEQNDISLNDIFVKKKKQQTHLMNAKYSKRSKIMHKIYFVSIEYKHKNIL